MHLSKFGILLTALAWFAIMFLLDQERLWKYLTARCPIQDVMLDFRYFPRHSKEYYKR
jgi:hypothetical protein